ncbi:MAG: phosphatidylserine/phosphatidylglycerophosphate/cardiolipin synthase family protein [Kofleriaceae bacterium]
MSNRKVVLVALGVLGSIACRAPSNSEDDDMVDAGSDGPDGVGCTALSPREVPLEAFVGPDGLQQRMTALIDSAQQTLDVHMYLWTVKPLADKIVAAKQRGVAVRVILDPDSPGNQAVRPIFEDGAIEVRDASALYPFSHAKYLIVDGKTAAIMSMNFNIDAMNSERNYGVIDRDPEDVADTIAIFEMDWAAAAGATPKPADLSCTRLVVAPNNARLRILELINGAKSTLDVEALYVSETTVRNAIGAAAGRGVAVRVILESDQDQPDNADSALFFKNMQIPVHVVTNQFYLHAKLIIADGVAFVGSENFSVSGLTKNRELGVMVFEPDAAAVISDQFDADWAATPAAP